MNDVVVPPLKTIEGLFAVAQEMTKGAGKVLLLRTDLENNRDRESTNM